MLENSSELVLIFDLQGHWYEGSRSVPDRRNNLTLPAEINDNTLFSVGYEDRTGGALECVTNSCRVRMGVGRWGGG